MRSPVWSSCKAALWFTAIGVSCGILVTSFGSPNNLGEGWLEFPFYSGVAAFVTSFAVWWQHVARLNKPGFWRGVAAGMVSGLLGHPVTWYFLICGNWVLVMLEMTPEPASGEALNPLNGLLGALVFSMVSVVLLGWLTVIAGAIMGGAIGAWQRNPHPARAHG